MKNKPTEVIQMIFVKNNIDSFDPITILPTRKGTTVIAFEVRKENNLEFLERLVFKYTKEL
jgi:hypothetical protein